MAEILIHKIEFLQNNTYGTYVAGDVLEVYADTDLLVANPYPLSFESTGIVVYLNDVLTTTGTYYDTSPAIVSVQNFNPQICNGTSLVVLSSWMVFPFVYYYTLANHYACTVNSPTCDLIMVGVPDVVPATDSTTSDGEITITASSSNAIEYNLGDDFTYGNGQSSGTFSGLYPGKYRVFIRDSKNCGLNVLVEVTYDNVYGAKYRLEYTDFASVSTKIEIARRGYAGDVIEVCGGDEPFSIGLRGEGSADKFYPILATDATLRLVDEETDQYFIELYTNDPNLYRLKYYKNNVLTWTGKILPFIYSEEYKSPPYYVDVTCSDSLPELKEFYFFQKDGTRFTGTMKLIKIIAYCLSKLRLDLNINVACNMYSTGMTTTAASDPLDQAYVDVQCFYLTEKEPTLEFVLQSILEGFGANIKQWDNAWNIVRVEEMGGSYDYRTFDKDGTYVSNSSYNPLVDIEYPSEQGVMFNGIPNLELQHGYGKFKVIYDLGLKENIIDNGDFEMTLKFVPGFDTYIPVPNTDGWQLINSDYTLYDEFDIIDETNIARKLSSDDTIFTSQNAGNAYLQTKDYNLKMGTNNTLKIKIRYKIGRTSTGFLMPIGVTFPYVKVRIMVTYGSLYLTSSGAWSSEENTVDFLATKLNEYLEGEVTANQPLSGTPVDGMIFNIRVYHATPFFAQVKTLTALRAITTYTGGAEVKPIGYKIELRDVFVLGPTNYMYYYELEENTTSASGYDLVRPDDYHAVNNPRQWVLKYRRALPSIDALEKITFFLDKLEMQFLTDNKEPIDSIVRVATGELNNKKEYEKKLIIGSSGDLISTTVASFFDLGAFVPLYLYNDEGGAAASVQTTNILSSEILYTGWLRDVNGNAWDFWTRDGVSEADKLHGVWLKVFGFQYRKSWRLLRCSLVSKTQNFSLLSCYREVNDGNRRYIPISGTLNDKSNTFSGELLELKFIGIDGEDAGSDGSGNSPFNSAFTTGFGGGYN